MKRKTHNAILWTITYIMIAIFLVSLSAMDSANMVIPVAGLFVSLGWIVVFANVNGERW